MTLLEKIANHEEECIRLAKEGKLYASEFNEMREDTHKLLYPEKPIRQSVHVVRKIPTNKLNIFLGIEVGDSVTVMAYDDVSLENIRIILIGLQLRFDETYNVNHIYTSERVENGIKMTRVG